MYIPQDIKKLLGDILRNDTPDTDPQLDDYQNAMDWLESLETVPELDTDTTVKLHLSDLQAGDFYRERESDKGFKLVLDTDLHDRKIAIVYADPSSGRVSGVDLTSDSGFVEAAVLCRICNDRQAIRHDPEVMTAKFERLPKCETCIEEHPPERTPMNEHDERETEELLSEIDEYGSFHKNSYTRRQ